MNIEEILAPDDVVIDLKASTKTPLLRELAERAAQRLGFDAREVAQEVLKREELGSTGVGKGIAIPHARLAHLGSPFGLLARLKKPIDFNAIDAEHVDLVFLLLQPGAQQSDLNALATVARALRDPETLKKLRQAADAGGLYRELTK